MDVVYQGGLPIMWKGNLDRKTERQKQKKTERQKDRKTERQNDSCQRQKKWQTISVNLFTLSPCREKD